MMFGIQIPPQHWITSGKCATCGVKSERQCRKCIEGLDVDGNHSPTFYCSEACETKDSSTHQASCLNANCREQLYRVGYIAQDVFLAVNETAFTDDVDTVRVQGGKLRVKIHDHEENQLLFDFPIDKFENDEDRRKMLTWNQCNGAVFRMGELIGNGLKCELLVNPNYLSVLTLSSDM